MKYTKENLEPIVMSSKSMAGVIRQLGLKYAGGSYSHLKKVIKNLDIKTDHFTGQAWNRGNKSLKYISAKDYIKKTGHISSHKLRKKLIKDGIKEEKCKICGISEWQGDYAPLELDHINRNNSDNSIKNLQIICSNCHSQKTRRDRRNKKWSS